MTKIFFTLLLTLTIVKAADAQSSKRVQVSNTEDNVAIGGYDPVAYFRQGKAVEGRKEFAVNADGIIYYCSSAANRDVLSKNYAIYEPQYGGWCAYAMGKTGEKVEVDPETFKIVDGKLFLFYNFYFNNTLTDWNANEASLKKNADANWKKISN